KKLLQVREAFQLAQKPHQNHAKLVVSLKSTYAQLDDKEGFNEKFVHFLKYAMIIYRREPAVEQVINFAAKFVTSFCHVEEEDGSEEREEDNLLLNYVFKFLLESHDANSHAVRYRTCQLINKILGNMPENAEIDDDLFDKINEAMLIRLKDKFPSVRIQAVLALSRLQNPKDENCPVVNIYCTLLENDSNSDVRRAVLSCIAPSERTLPIIVGRTMDVKDAVRKLAYEVLAEKVHIRALTIAQRVKLLQQGLNDRSDAVKEVMKRKLIQAWLQFSDGDVLELLHKLDVENCPEVAIPVLNAMFSLSPLHDIVQNCKNLDSRKLIPVEDLTAENVLYWRCLCEYLKSNGEEGEVLLEQVLPEPAIYADYLLSYLQTIPVLGEEQKNDFDCFVNLMTKEFIGQQLILIIGCMDTMEEGGRKHLLVILQKILILPSTSAALIPLLVERLLSIITDEDRRIQVIAEITSEVREPIVAVDQPVDAAEIRKQNLELAKIKMKLIEAKKALEECVTLQDFNRAAVLKEEITELEHTKNDLIKAAEQAEIKEMRVEKNDPETLLKCLIMCYEVLKIMSLSKGISPTIYEIIQSLILPSVTNVHPAVRNMAVLCLGCCTLQNKEFAQQQLPLLFEVLQVDNIKIKLGALKAIFDQLMLFGIEPFKTRRGNDSQSESAHIRTENGEDESETKEEEEETATVQSLLKVLSGFLDSEDSELRTEAAEGIAKLMFSGRLISAKLLSRLVLLWYNPVTEDDTRLRHCLGVFFPLFAYANRSNQECFEEAFFPTLQTLLNAPATSPLAEVDISNVSELLVDLTRPSGLKYQCKKSQDYQELTVHDTLAVKICNEILADPTAADVRIYAKALNSLELSSSATENLLVLLNEIQEKVEDKPCQRVIEKIQMKLTKDPNVSKSRSGRTEETGLSERTQEGDITLSENNVHNEEENNKDTPHTPVNEVKETAKLRSTRSKAGKGQRKAATEVRSVTRRKTGASVKRGLESCDRIPEPVPVSSSRPQRRAKTLALEKTRMNLSRLLNEATDE
ncbi:CND3 protein, partial [Daphoenositta chrysoptera]|nr:CND3 protein [Daphoenositta chrysoptera]